MLLFVLTLFFMLPLVVALPGLSLCFGVSVFGVVVAGVFGVATVVVVWYVDVYVRVAVDVDVGCVGCVVRFMLIVC